MQALAYPQTQTSRTDEPPGLQSAWEEELVGRYRRITVHQLCMVWWLYSEGHITRRGLRVYFALHEMAERREYSDAKARYSLEELKYLVGGRGSKRADTDLTADAKSLSRVGLVELSRHTIVFARNVSQLSLEDTSGFAELLGRMPHPKRVVPVPRRTLRALAAGFGKAVTAVMIATMIRSLFWHRGEDTPYRVDGRTKGSWIAETFGVSRKAVSNARSQLTELGWISPVPSQQWELNRWGAHDRINPEWSHTRGLIVVDGEASPVENRAGDQVEPAGESASPPAENPGGITSPDLNNSASSNEEDLITRKPSSAPGARRQARLVSKEAIRGVAGDRQPSLRDIHSEDLADMESVLELYRQAQNARLAGGGEGGRLEFVAMVERARGHGKRPGALLTWLLRERRHEFITQSDEDRAAERIRRHRDGPRRTATQPEPVDLILSKEDAVVRVCLLVAKQHRGISPERLARERYGWTSEQWQNAHLAYEAKERSRWS